MRDGDADGGGTQSGTPAVVGRMAPSPTGRMHIGNVYALLAAWLDARRRRGRVLLRIEDIDTPRVMPDADRWIMDDLLWLGMDWDGEPVYQSRRRDLYHRALRSLRSQTLSVHDRVFGGRGVGVSEPLTYPCFCSRADIRAASAPQEPDGFVIYPGTCRRMDSAERLRRLRMGDHRCWRIAMPARPDAAAADCVFDDRVFGRRCFNLATQVGDVVIRRSDGLVAYQLAVVVDDLAMGVTHVVRGRDLLRSTAVQQWIGQHIDPAHMKRISYAHLPLVVDRAGRRLAKRDRVCDLASLRRRGVPAVAVIGYCAWLLGLIPRPEPASPADLLDVFSWDNLRAHPSDRIYNPDDLPCSSVTRYD